MPGSNQELFKFWIEQGWKQRLSYNEHMKANVAQYKSRLKYEVSMIQEKEFVDYFLIVSDLIRWAKRNGIGVGPGRGSSAASLACYLLQITEIDPMQFPMLFERFLDPTRTDPPDIDIDFEDERREEVFAYAASKYGHDKVANIGSFTRYLGKTALDDIARVYHIPKWAVESIKSKLIVRAEGHPRFSKTLVDTYDSFPDVMEIVNQFPGFKYAPKLEGQIRGMGIHAAGLVIANEEFTDYCATYERTIGTKDRVAQAIPFDKRDAAVLGMLKIDALSLITMSELANMCRDAGITLTELYRVSLNDPETIKLFRDGDILGIFQFEGTTTRRILKAVAPTNFMHLADVNALARPGADDRGYIANKNSGVMPEFAHEIIAQHTTKWPNTYGTITYEEQILMILRDLGGFAPAELNRMRKIIHDKLGSSVFNEYYERFVKGAAAHNLSQDTAKQVWDGMVNASGYAFNIAHSVSYSAISYWQAYLKAHYTPSFYKTKLQKCSDNVRRGKFIAEASRHGILVSPPKLKTSGHDWVLYGNEIIAGLQSIEGIGPATAQNIIDWRNQKLGVPNQLKLDVLDVEEVPLPDEQPVQHCLARQQVSEKYLEFEVDDLSWDDLIEVKGIGKKTIQKIKDFVYSDDPFGVFKTERTLTAARQSIASGDIMGVPRPTHTSIDIPPERELVTYIGIVRGRKYYDAVEQLMKRETEELSYEEALSRLKDSHLLKYVALDVEDEYGEIVKVRLNRWKYPMYKDAVTKMKMNATVVVAQGNSSDFGGISIQTDKLFVL